MGGGAASAQVWNAGADLKANELNPATELTQPAPWSYGKRPTVLGPTFVPLANHVDSFQTIDALEGWHGGDTGFPSPVAVVNVSNAPVSEAGILGAPGDPIGVGMMFVHPTDGGQANPFGVVRWTAPAAGTYDVAANWTDISNGAAGGADVHVVVNGISIFDGLISLEEANVPDAATFPSTTVPLLAGQTVEFVIGPNGSYGNDGAAFNATITVPEPTSLALLGLPMALAFARRRKQA